MKVYRKYSVKGIVDGQEKAEVLFTGEKEAKNFMGIMCGCAYNDGQEKAEVIYTVYHTPIRSKNQLEFSFMSE